MMRTLWLRGSRPSWLLSLLLVTITLLSLTPSLRLLVSALSQLSLGEQSPFWQVMNSSSTWRALANSLYTASLGALV